MRGWERRWWCVGRWGGCRVCSLLATYPLRAQDSHILVHISQDPSLTFLPYTLTHSLTYTLTHSLTHSLTHLLTPSFKKLFKDGMLFKFNPILLLPILHGVGQFGLLAFFVLSSIFLTLYHLKTMAQLTVFLSRFLNLLKIY